MTEDQGPLLDPAEYAALVRDASDEQLARGMAVNRDPILEQIFAAMPSQLSRDAVVGIELIADWKILDRPDGGYDRWQVTISSGACSVVRDGDRRPDVTFRIKPVEFIKLVTGNANGPMLFVFGSLKIEGDLLKAARYQSYFRRPHPRPEQ
jgi:predicted lipid carrier protein YhbT